MKTAKVFFTNNDGSRSKSYNYITNIEDLSYGDKVIVETGQWYSVATFEHYCLDEEKRASKFILQYFDAENAEALREKALKEERLKHEIELKIKEVEERERLKLIAEQDEELLELVKKLEGLKEKGRSKDEL